MAVNGSFCFIIFTLIGELFMSAYAKNYTYDFKVFSVSRCPKNLTEFQKSAFKRNCSIGTRYNCSPNRDLSSLIEFCTNRPRKLYQYGNCLRLEGKGDFNHVKCSSFIYGCPSESYFDDQLYKFEACLEINALDSCFLADRNCSKTEDDLKTGTRNQTTTTASKGNHAISITIAVLFIFISIFIAAVVFFKFRGRCRKEKRKCADGKWTVLENLDKVQQYYKMLQGQQVPVYHVQGYVVGFSGSQKDDILDNLRQIKFISLNPKDLKPTFACLEKIVESCTPNLTTDTKQHVIMNEPSAAAASASQEFDVEQKKEEHPLIEDGENAAEIENGNAIRNKSLKTFDDHRATLALSDFSGKINIFHLQQMCIKRNVFYIFAIDMLQHLEETPLEDFDDCEGKILREYYAKWIDTILTYSEEKEHSFIFVAVNTHSLSLEKQNAYFDEIWSIYEHKSRNEINEDDRRKRECVCRKHHLFRTNSEDLYRCIVRSLERNKNWGISLPSFWGAVESFILKKRKTSSILKRHELVEFCNDLNDCEFTSMLNYFHNVGLVVYFDKEPQRNTIIIDVNCFLCTIRNLNDSNYLKENCRISWEDLNKGLLTLDQLNAILLVNGNGYRSYLQFLRILAVFEETSTDEECFYLPFLNKNPIDKISDTYRQSSILCFKFQYLPPCLFHRLVVSCIETSNWTVRTDKSGKNLYSAAAIFKCENHDILLGFNGNVVEARILMIETLPINLKITKVVKEDLENILNTLCENLYPQAFFQGGYKCKAQAEFCDFNDSSFITEKELRTNDNGECPHCEKNRSHSINADLILGHWNEIPIRASSKDSIQVEEDGELTAEDSKLASSILLACTDGNFQQFQHECKRNQVQKLLNRGFLHKHDKDGYTILHRAAEGGSLKILLELLKNDDKTDVLETSDIGETVLHIACKNSRLDMCVYLLSHYQDLIQMKSKRNWSAIHFAAWGGNTDIMDLLEKKCLNLNDKTSNGYSILHIAARENRYDMCKYILEKHPQLLMLETDNGLIAAHYAVKRCNEKIFKLFEKDIDINYLTNDGKSILHIACEVGNLNFFEYIFKLSTSVLRNVDDEGWDALHFAAKSGNIGIVKKLTLEGMNGEHKTIDGKTILHIACIHKRFGMCCYITNTFPQLINQCNERGWNAAHYVAVEPKQHDESIKFIDHLNSCNIDLLKVTEGGNTILTAALSYKNIKLARYLAKKYPELLQIRSTKSIFNVAAESNDREVQAFIKELNL